jgi:thiamine-monophosphate kinase
MNELELLRRIQGKLPSCKGGGVVLGIGDDCAIFRPRGSPEDLLISTDMTIEDVHFRRRTHPASSVGHRALARGLSDIAAMGGISRLCLVSLALASGTGARWVEDFYRGLGKLAAETGTAVAGGDLSHAEKVTCDVVVCGTAPRASALRRDGARPGDHIYVSGRLGGPALGLARGRGRAWNLHLRPAPRLELGRFLRERLRASAAIDLSDGLSLDLHRLCLASGVTASLDREPPRFPEASLEQALHGGEDYELLFTLRPGGRPPPSYRGVPLTRIGTIQKGKRGAILLNERPLPALGYDHFRDS